MTLRNKKPDVKVGEIFRRLTVKSEPFQIPTPSKSEPNRKRWYVDCVCDCGKEKTCGILNLQRGSVGSCGCIVIDKNLSLRENSLKIKFPKLYSSWTRMKTKCYNKKHPTYKTCGAVGISVCDEWVNDFETFCSWAIETGWTNDLCLMRKKINDHFTPDNCSWVNRKKVFQQRDTTRLIEFNGTTKCLSEWAKEIGVDRSTLAKRLDSGWSVEDSITSPVWTNMNNKRLDEKLFEKKDEILSSYKLDISPEDIIEQLKLNCCGQKLRDFIRSCGVEIKRWQLQKLKHIDTDDAIYRYSILRESVREIADLYDCSTKPINDILSLNNIYRYGYKKYIFNDKYFKNIDTPEKAYWLGLIYADGSVSNNIFRISLQRGDRYILEQLASDVEYDGPIKDSEITKSIGGRPSKTYYSSSIALCGKLFTDFLKIHGIIENKTFRLAIPSSLPFELYNHFVRGLFDGDGCISLSKNNGRNTQVFVICGCERLIDEVNKVIAKAINRNPSRLIKISDKLCELRYGGFGDVLAIREWLYQNASRYFVRKYDKFVKIQKPILKGLVIRRKPIHTGFSIREAAKYVGISARTMGKYIEKGGVKIYLEKGVERIRVPLSELDRLKKLLSSNSIMPWDGRLKNIGENNTASKLTYVEVQEIRKIYKEGEKSCKKLAKIYNVSDTLIRSIVSGKIWRHLMSDSSDPQRNIK